MLLSRDSVTSQAARCRSRPTFGNDERDARAYIETDIGNGVWLLLFSELIDGRYKPPPAQTPLNVYNVCDHDADTAELPELPRVDRRPRKSRMYRRQGTKEGPEVPHKCRTITRVNIQRIVAQDCLHTAARSSVVNQTAFTLPPAHL
jgi:hypothetical protein